MAFSTSASNQSMKSAAYSSEATTVFATAITLMILFTIMGNILVIIAVITSRSLRGPQNLFLVSLAVADILVATLIIPFSLANELMGYWYFSPLWCEIHQALDVFFCTASIIHLCAISLDRYMSISRPLIYRAQRTPCHVKCAILVVWFISAVISFPPLLSINKNQGDSSTTEEPQCPLNKEQWYILYSTIGSFFAPCLIMILVYIRIYQIAKQRIRCPPGEPTEGIPAGAITPKEEALQKGYSMNTPYNLQRNTTTSRRPTLTVPLDEGWNHPASLHQTPTPPPVLTPSHSPSIFSIQNQDAAPNKPKQVKKEQDNHSECSSSGADTEIEQVGDDHDNSILSPATVQTYRDTVSIANKASQRATVNREKRLTFVLAVVIGVFVLCWFPFFFSYSLQAVCPKTCQLPEPVFTFFFWIGYCNSCLNPVIYTIFNKDFRRAFKKIVCRNTKGTYL